METGGIEPDQAIAQDARLDRAVLAALVVDHHIAVRVQDQVVLDAAKREIAVELEPMVLRSRARRQDLDDNDWVRDLQRVEVGGGQTTRASGSKALRGVIRTVMPSGNIRQGNPARSIPFSSAFWAAYLVSA